MPGWGSKRHHHTCPRQHMLHNIWRLMPGCTLPLALLVALPARLQARIARPPLSGTLRKRCTGIQVQWKCNTENDSQERCERNRKEAPSAHTPTQATAVTSKFTTSWLTALLKR
eukprot:6159478-Amphidinium_carterae.2